MRRSPRVYPIARWLALATVAAYASVVGALGPYTAVEITAPVGTQDLEIYAANSAGHAVGYRVVATDTADFQYAVVWRDGVLSDLQLVPSLPDLTHAIAVDINDADQIVGQVCPEPFLSSGCRAVLWPSPTAPAINLGTFTTQPPTQPFSFARAINAAGTVAGLSAPSAAFQHPLGGALQAVGSGPVSNVWAVNATGTIAVDYFDSGTSTFQTSFVNGATSTPLPNLGIDSLADVARPHVLNDAGTLLVRTTDVRAMVRAANGALAPLPALAGDPANTHTSALAIDADGQVAGILGNPFDRTSSRAVLWRSDRTPVLLASLVPATPAGFRWVRANDLRANDVVVAQGERNILHGVNTTEEGKEYPFFLLTPASYLSATLRPTPAEVTLGEHFTLTLAVTNTAATPLTNVRPAPPFTQTGDGELHLLSGPVPASVATLAVGATTNFVWEFETTKEGRVVIQSRAQAQIPGGATATVEARCGLGGATAATLDAGSLAEPATCPVEGGVEVAIVQCKIAIDVPPPDESTTSKETFHYDDVRLTKLSSVKIEPAGSGYPPGGT